MYAECTITIGDEDTESTSTCRYKDCRKNKEIGGCLAEAFTKADCHLFTLRAMMKHLIASDVFQLDADELGQLKQALAALKE